MWGMMRKIVGLMTSCTKGQEIHIGFKDNYNRREILRSLITHEEETSTLTVDSEEEDEEEAWVEAKDKSFFITAPNWVICQGTIGTLIPLAATTINLNMLLRIVQHY
jgi:hypothetical protein